MNLPPKEVKNSKHILKEGLMPNLVMTGEKCGYDYRLTIVINREVDLLLEFLQPHAREIS